MPIPNEYLDVIQMLATATSEARVRWQKTDFGIEVSISGSKFQLWTGTDENTERGFVAFGIREGKALVDSWFVDEGDKDFELTNDLFQSARRQAFGVSQKLDRLKELLARGEPIGDGPRVEE